MKHKTNISVAIITKNEENRLPDNLKSVSFADEIVILDLESSDKTVEILYSNSSAGFLKRNKKALEGKK